MAHLRGLALVRGFDLVDQPFLGTFGDGAALGGRASPAQGGDAPAPAAGESGAEPVYTGGGTVQPGGGEAEAIQAEMEEMDDLSWLWADDEEEQ
jgi:hypothetical protein